MSDGSGSVAGDIARWVYLYNNGPLSSPMAVIVKWDAKPAYVAPPVYEWDDPPPSHIEVSPQVFRHLQRIADAIEVSQTPLGVLWPAGIGMLGNPTWRRTQRETRERAGGGE